MMDGINQYISDDEYRETITERIEDALGEALIRVYNEIADTHGFRNVDTMDEFDGKFYDCGYCADMTGIAIDLFYALGMDVWIESENDEEE